MLTSAVRAAVLLFVLAGPLAVVTPAAAALTCVAWGDTNPEQGGAQYGCTQYVDNGGGDDGGGSGSGPVTPPCTFFGIWNDFCSGAAACYINDPAALQDPDDPLVRRDTPGLPEKPAEADHLVFTSCKEGEDGVEARTYVWNTEFEGPTLEDQIRAAVGQLVLPSVTPVFNPPTQSLVNLDTWWWAEGASTDEIVGSDALGLRAVATPRGMTVVATAGSRSERVTCPVVTSRSDQCSMTFRRAGIYDATLSVDYDIRFEFNGQAIEVPAGLQDLTTLSTTAQTSVPVVEVQSLVTGIR